MSKKSAPKQREKEKQTADYYRLNTKAIDDLISADKSNSPSVSEEELRAFGAARKSKIPHFLKVLFVKFWFPAAVCFFFLWGLGTYINDMLDMLVIIALALGTVTDLLTNNALRFFSAKEGGNDKWMMYPGKRFVTLPLNILHSGIILFLIFTFYNVANRLLISLTDAPSGSVPLGVEPLLFGVMYVLFDSLLIFCKHLSVRIITDARNQVDNGNQQH